MEKKSKSIFRGHRERLHIGELPPGTPGKETFSFEAAALGSGRPCFRDFDRISAVLRPQYCG
jgi:hypothetical protein